MTTLATLAATLAAALAATLEPGRLAEPLSAHRPGPGIDDDEVEERPIGDPDAGEDFDEDDEEEDDDDDDEEPLQVSK